LLDLQRRDPHLRHVGRQGGRQVGYDEGAFVEVGEHGGEGLLGGLLAAEPAPPQLLADHLADRRDVDHDGVGAARPVLAHAAATPCGIGHEASKGSAGAAGRFHDRDHECDHELRHNPSHRR
jgi:hypothetical protein